MSTSRKFFTGRQPTTAISRDALQPGSLIFRCNICGNKCIVPVGQLDREIASCPTCSSTVRMRSIIHALSITLFGQSLALPDFPLRPDIRAIGLSDWDGYASPLALKLNYQNTFYHQEPRLDIMSIAPELEDTLDILISTEVFEHVPPPVSTAFQNSIRLLKPDGTLILTVPYVLKLDPVEHFPDLNEYEIRNENGKFVLHNTTRDGQKQIFENLVFHGGPGQTLEMRVFSLSWLMEELNNAGFEEIRILSTHNFEHGIFFKEQWSLPVTARKPQRSAHNTVCKI